MSAKVSASLVCGQPCPEGWIALAWTEEFEEAPTEKFDMLDVSKVNELLVGVWWDRWDSDVDSLHSLLPAGEERFGEFDSADGWTTRAGEDLGELTRRFAQADSVDQLIVVLAVIWGRAAGSQSQ